MHFRTHLTVISLGAVLATSGCASAGPSGDELRNTIYATHRMVQNLDDNLSGTVSQLTQTTADLSARVDASDQQLRELNSLALENQRKLETLQASLDSLTTTLYRHFNLSPPQPITAPPPAGGPVQRPGVTIEPPPGRTPGPSATPPQGQPQSQTTQPGVQVTPPAQPQGTQETSGEFTPPTGMDEISHYRSAQQLYAREDYAAALEKFKEDLQLFPDSPNADNATYWMAHCYFKLGDYQQAIDGFEQLRAKYPNSDKVPTAMHNEAVAYSRLGQNARAIELFQRLIREYPDNPATESARQKLRQLQDLN